MTDCSLREASQPGIHSDSQWKEFWSIGRTPWHRNSVDEYLHKYIGLLTKNRQSTSIFVPLCGKSVDLLWLCKQGHTVVGVELSEIAIKQLFKENSIPHSVTEAGEFILYRAQDRNLTVLVGSLFDLTPEVEGMFDAVWDSRAFGAVNPSDRSKYIGVLRSVLKPGGSVLLSNLEYECSEYPGPPFSLSLLLIKELFGEHFEIELLEHVDLTGTLVTERFNLSWAKEQLHLLQLLPN